MYILCKVQWTHWEVIRKTWSYLTSSATELWKKVWIKILWKKNIYSLTCILHLVHCWWIVLYRNVFANIIFGHIFVGIWKTVFTSHTLSGGQQVITLHYWHPLFAQSRCIVSYGHYLNLNFGPLLELLSWQQAITVFTNNTMAPKCEYIKPTHGKNYDKHPCLDVWSESDYSDASCSTSNRSWW